MTTSIAQPYPTAYEQIAKSTIESGFTMASDVLTCSLLRTLASTKPSGRFLELGTGTGLSTSWILDGMDSDSKFISVDNDSKLLAIAASNLGHDKRLSLVNEDGGDWIKENTHLKFDYIFADTWSGKYFFLNETLALLKCGSLYIIDDMLSQPNWPEGHADKVSKLVSALEKRTDLTITKQNWATGIIIATKKVMTTNFLMNNN